MNVVEGRGIVVGFGDTVAIATSDFIVPAGGVTAVIGPNGSGKSTLLKLIAGLVTPVRGTLDVAVDRDDIAYVLQATRVDEALPITVREVVAMGRYPDRGWYRWMNPDDRSAIDRALERLRLGDIADRHLHELSGGQRQRVFVAQGLAQDHELLLLDEPLTGLDAPSAQAVDDVVHDEIGRGSTVVMTTHDLSEARVADHVLLLSGRVVASGPPAEVLTQEHLREAYGEALLHVEQGEVFLDDPAHLPVEGRHVHRERSIHVETDRSHTDGR